jgi:hypothetical protein
LRRAAGRTSEPLADGSGLGLLSFLAVSLGMHPLLVPEVAVVFFLALGLVRAAGGRASGGEEANGTWTRWQAPLVATALACLALAMPLRGEAIVRRANLEGLGIGLSGWKSEERERRFRTAVPPAVLFVDATRGQIELPLRVRRTTRASEEVELIIDGRAPVRVSVPADRWSEISVPVVSPHDRRFSRLELRWAAPTDRSTRLDIGRER